MQGRPPIGARRGAVRLVDDDRVPGDVLDRTQDFRPLYEIVRGDVDPRKRPWVDVRRPLRRHRSQPPRVGKERVQPEARGQLAAPLLAQTGGRDHERAAGLVAMRELEQQEARLNRLAQADAIRDEETRDPMAEHRQRRLELIGQEPNRRPRSRVQRPERMQPHESPVERVEPPARTDHARARIAVERSRPIERRQQRLRAVARRSRSAAEPRNPSRA